MAWVVFGVGLADEFEVYEEHVGGTEDVGGSAVEAVSFASGVVLEVDGFVEDELLDELSGLDGEGFGCFIFGEVFRGVCAQELVAEFFLSDLYEQGVGIEDPDDLGFDQCGRVWRDHRGGGGRCICVFRMCGEVLAEEESNAGACEKFETQ